MIEVADRDGVAIIRMADGKANAMSIESCDELVARFEENRLSPARAAVITGSGTIFSAGVDLLRVLDGGRPYIRKLLPVLNAMLLAVFSHPKPVVAAINGHAIAGGCILACAADRRLMARETGRIGVPELLVGVAFPAVAIEIIRSATGPHQLEEAIFSAATCPPAEALACGLVHELSEPDMLLDRAVAEAGRLAALPAAAFALSKRQTRAPALERLQRVGQSIDSAVDEIWTAPETIERIRGYVARTFKKA
ncbi:MAG TPA: enoyl-CoA hydratase/isomerase family protein [Xanthobacteraceae bacterium]